MQQSWVVCQIGAREHYSIPRALLRMQQSVTLVTDFWAGRRVLPGVFRRLNQRTHFEIARKDVVSFNFQSVRREFENRVLRRRGWESTLKRNSWFDHSASRWLDRHLCRTNQKPIVFSYSYAAKGTFRVAKKHGCKTVLGQIDPGPVETRLLESLCRDAGILPQNSPPYRYWENWSKECDLADEIVVNSKWSLTALLEEGVPKEKIRVIPLVYEPEFKSPAQRTQAPVAFSIERPLKVLFLGQVNRRKGIVELSQAIRSLAGYPIEWTIVGDGDNVLMNDLSSLPNTSVVGAVSRAETKEFYETSDLFILPTHSDGFALTQLEACVYGLPIIASRNCGEVVEHQRNGLLLDEVTGGAIVRAIKEVLENPNLLLNYRMNQLARPCRSLVDLGADLSAMQNSNQLANRID